MNRSLLLTGALALLASSGNLYAQRAGGPISFAALDADDDGNVTLEEFKENFNPDTSKGFQDLCKGNRETQSGT